MERKCHSFLTPFLSYRQRLTEVTFKTSAGVVTKKIAYTYDAFDRLIAKQVDATGDGTYELAERYVYDGSDIVLVTDETGAITHRYLHGPAIDQIFADEQLGEDVRWALSDNQGTVRDWVVEDTTTGTTSIVDHLDYNAYGQITAHTDPQNSNQASTDEIHYAYTGREWDVGLGEYSGRLYEPSRINDPPSADAARLPSPGHPRQKVQ